MSSLSQAASSVGKRTNARYWTHGDVVYRHILQLRRPRYAFYCRFGNGQRYRPDPVGMGYVFSAFSWALCYRADPWWLVAGPFGSNASTSGRSLSGRCLPLLQGFVDIFSGFGIIVALFTLRFLVGLAEAPSFPGNSRIVAAWFPAQERGTAMSIFNLLNTSQRSSAPIMAG